MGDDRDRRKILLMNQLREIVNVAIHRIVAFSRPLAIAVTTQVGRDNVPVGTQGLGDGVPVAAMVTPAMDQYQWRRVPIAPLNIMQAQALRNVET